MHPSKAPTLVLILALALPSVAFAKSTPEEFKDDQKEARRELAAHKEITQLRLDALKEKLEQGQQDFVQRLDAQDKRIGDAYASVDRFGIIVAVFGGFFTLLGLAFGFGAWWSAGRKADEAVREWLKKNGGELLDNLREHAKDVHEKMDHLGSKVQQEAQRHIQEQMMSLPGQKPEVSPVDRKALAEGDEKLKNKAESTYTAEQWAMRGFAAYEQGRIEEAILYLQRAAHADEADDAKHARWLYTTGRFLSDLERWHEANTILDDVIQRFGAIKEPALVEVVAWALVNKSYNLVQLKQAKEAIGVCNEIERRYGAMPYPDLREQVLIAMVNKSAALGEIDQEEQVVAVSTEIGHRFGSAADVGLQQWVAKASINKGLALSALHREKEALTVFDEVIDRYRPDQQSNLQEIVATASVGKGAALDRLGRYQDAIDVYDDAIQRLGAARQPSAQECLARALANKATSLSHLHRYDEAKTLFDAVLERLGASTATPLRKQVAHALNGKGFVLLMWAKTLWAQEIARKENLETALACFCKALEHTTDKPVALGNQGYTLFLLGRSPESRESLRQALREGGQRLYDAELEDSRMSPVPEDKAFRALLDELWREVSGSAQPSKPE